MPVVINDFEIVTEPPSNQRSNTSTSEEESASNAPTPREIEQMLRQLLERLARVKAH